MPSRILEFTLNGQILYPMVILNRLNFTQKDRMPDDNLEGAEDGR
jgi:hypothetical protein